MNNKKHWLKAVFSAFVIWTNLITSVPVRAQDIVTSEDISGGSSVFVFRQSRKNTQGRSNFRSNNGGLQANQRKASRDRARKQATTVAFVQRKRTPKVDPNTVAANRPPKNTGKNTPIPTATREQASIKLAGAAETYLEKNQLDLAVEYFEQAVELDPKNENAKLGLSEALSKKGDAAIEKADLTSAVAFYERAVKVNPKNSAAFVGLAEAYESTEDNDKAIASYEKALVADAALTDVYAPLGMLYYQKGDIPQADTYLTKAVAKNPADGATQYYFGQIRFKQNKNDEAIAAFKQSLASNPAESHYYLGETYDRLNRSEEAFAEYKQAVQINPNYLEAWFDLAAANYNRGNYEEAVNGYKQVIRLKNDYGQAHANLADSYRQMAMASTDAKKRHELYGLAIGAYQLASVFIKNDAELYSNWGFSLGRVAKWDVAAERLHQAVEISPDPADYTNIGWANYNSAQEDLKQNKNSALSEQQKAENTAKAQAKLQKGKSALEKAISLDPKYVAAYLNLGITSTDLGDFQGSVNALKTAVSLWEGLKNPNKQVGIMSTNELGLAYRQLNDLENAVNQFKKVTSLDDRFAAGWYNLGEAEYRRGNKGEAKKAADKLRGLNSPLANDLTIIISGAVFQGTKNKVENKVKEKTVNKLPKIPKLPY